MKKKDFFLFQTSNENILEEKKAVECQKLQLHN